MISKKHGMKRTFFVTAAAMLGLGGAGLLVPQPQWAALSPIAAASAQQERAGAGGHGSSGHGGGALGQPGGSSGSGRTGGVGGQFGAGSESHGQGGGGRSGFGYWGGRHVPEGPGEPPTDGTGDNQTPSSDQTASDGSTTGHGAANLGGNVGTIPCNGLGAGANTAERRMQDENLKRLLIVRAMLEKSRNSKVSPVYSGGVVNLARFQEELERTHPNLTLAGMYLGRVADVPVTASIVETASSALCVPLRPDMASAIAGVAEAQREALLKAGQRPAGAKP